MPQIEYGDFYKFVVSLGIALVLAAILVPWLFLREPFDLMTEASRLSQLTPIAQHIVELRQADLLRLLPIVPWFSFCSFSAGAALTSIGLLKWSQRQRLRDTSEELGVKKQELELRSMTSEEVNDKVDAEIQPEVNSGAVGLVRDASAVKLRAVESAFYDRVRNCFGTTYRLLVNQMLGTAEYDAILQALRPTNPDIVIEIKYIRRGFKYSWLRESTMRLALATQFYDARLERKSIPVLIVIFSTEEASQQADFQDLLAKAQADLGRKGVGVRIEYASEGELPGMSCDQLQRFIVGSKFSAKPL